MARLQPAHRQFIDRYLSLKCQVKLATDAVGWPREYGHEVLRRPEVKAYLERRQQAMADAVDASALDVVALLVQHMKADLADILPDNEVLQEAKRNGVSHLIKRIKVTKTPRRVLAADGSVSVEYEERTEIEIHDSQKAAVTLGKIFGLESQDELAQARRAIKMYCEMQSCTPDVAIVALAPHVPGVLRVKDEFLNRPQLTEGDYVDGDVATD